jgi:hypothetical protein|tara:strand:+ start:42 stop:374 length:333 start_codon:yes stop_codon:yes gene_type:complete
LAGQDCQKQEYEYKIFHLKKVLFKGRTFCSFVFMKLVLKILFIIFILWMLLGGYLESTEHPKGPIVMGLGVMYLSFIFMPVFIYWRYKDGKYKKYIINDKTLLGEMKKEE